MQFFYKFLKDAPLPFDEAAKIGYDTFKKVGIALC